MIFKESSNITYALYKCVDEEVTITLDNIEEWVDLLNRDNYFYYKITDINLINAATEYQDKVHNNEPIYVDVVRFNHIFAVVKKYCSNAKRSLL